MTRSLLLKHNDERDRQGYQPQAQSFWNGDAILRFWR